MYRLEVLKSLKLQAVSLLVKKSDEFDSDSLSLVSFKLAIGILISNKSIKIFMAAGFTNVYLDKSAENKKIFNELVELPNSSFATRLASEASNKKASSIATVKLVRMTLDYWSKNEVLYPDWRFFRAINPDANIPVSQLVQLFEKYKKKFQPKTTEIEVKETPTSTISNKPTPHPIDKYKFLSTQKFHADPFIVNEIHKLIKSGKMTIADTKSMTKIQILYLIKTQGTIAKLEDKHPTNQTALPKEANSKPLPNIGSSSTGAKPVLIDNEVYIQKYGASKEHIINEHLANSIYDMAGVPTPQVELKTDKDGKPYQLSKYIEGKQLGDLPEQQRNAAYLKLRTHFIIDAWLGNWDVIGKGGSNIIVSTSGEVYRVDNGGSISYKAMGGTKVLDATVTELNTMRNSTTNPEAFSAFAGLDEDDLIRQFKRLEPSMIKILHAIKANGATYSILKQRLQYLQDRFYNNNYGSAPILDKTEKDSILNTDINDLRANTKFVRVTTWYELTTGIKVSSKSDIAQMIQYMQDTTCLPYDPTDAKLSSIGMPKVMDIVFDNHEKNAAKYISDLKSSGFSHLTDSVYKYTGAAYKYNTKLRFNEGLDPQDIQMIKDVDQFLLYAPKYSGTVYRGFGSDELVQVLHDRFNAKQPIVLRGFTSTAINEEASFTIKPYHMQIITKLGVYINSISAWEDIEFEVLLPRNSLFNITKIGKNSADKPLFYLEEI